MTPLLLLHHHHSRKAAATAAATTTSSRHCRHHHHHRKSTATATTSTSRQYGVWFWFCLFAVAIVTTQITVGTAAAASTTTTDFYKLLGLSRDATSKEIKKAYRAKSLEYHPDKNKEEGAAEKFAEIARAYEVLSNDELRSIYDRAGEEGLKQHEQMGGAGAGGGGFGFEDIFEQFGFNFGGGGGRRRQDDREQKTPSVEVPLHLTLNQLYLGETLEVKYTRQVLCLQWEMCIKQAPECHGPGVRVRRQQLAPGFVQQVQQADDRCVARGKMWTKNCSACPQKTSTETIELTIEVTPGLRAGEAISFEGVTDERPGYQPGDLHFILFEEPHPDYHRDRDDLYKTMEVPLVDALTGFSVDLVHLDGKTFTVDVNTVTDCDHVMRVPGKGMPRRNGRGFGDLYLTFEVDFPDELTEKQKKAIREILGDDNGDSSSSSNSSSSSSSSSTGNQDGEL